MLQLCKLFRAKLVIQFVPRFALFIPQGLHPSYPAHETKELQEQMMLEKSWKKRTRKICIGFKDASHQQAISQPGRTMQVHMPAKDVQITMPSFFAQELRIAKFLLPQLFAHLLKLNVHMVSQPVNRMSYQSSLIFCGTITSQPVQIRQAFLCVFFLLPK